VKFPYKLCTYDYLTHLCPKLKEAVRLLSQLPAVMTNLFPQNQHMAPSSSNAENVLSGNQNPLTHEGYHLCVNMIKYHINVPTRSHNYNFSQIVLGLESPFPSETPLQI
jgi:hypothetical protein